MNYVLHILVMVCIYEILIVSLNLVVGYGGMLSLCHAAFYGIGAYTSALLITRLGWNFGASMVAAIALVGVTAYSIALLTSRFRGDFFVLATLGYQVIIFTVLYNWMSVTGGSYGVLGIPKPSMLGWRFASVSAFLGLSGTTAVVVLVVLQRVFNSPYGRTLQAVRDDELAAQSLGKDVRAFRRTALTVSAMAAATAGVLYASYASYIDPTSFSVDESILMLGALIIGGVGNLTGALIGAAILVCLPEVLRFLPIPDAIAAGTRQVLYGLLLIVMMRVRPQGLAGRYAFD